MRALLCACALALSACTVAGGMDPAGEPVREVRPRTVEHFDENVRRAEICSTARPLDFYDNREYCLSEP